MGAREPGIACSMGLKTRATSRALPRTFTTAAVHLCMKDPALNSAPVGGTPCGG